VYTGASEIGQGSDTMVAQIVAEGLGCKLGRVKVIAADTDLTPIDIGSYSSRVTFMNGNAALRAAEEVKRQIVSAAAKKMGCAPEEVLMRNDVVSKRGWPQPEAVAADSAPRGDTTMAGRVEGQILRGSVQQKRKDEG